MLWQTNIVILQKPALPTLKMMLSVLYLKGAILPQALPEEDSINERYVTEEQYESQFNTLRGVFGAHDEFILSEEDGSIRYSLSEMLTDIYQDMKDYVLLFQHPISSAKIQAASNIKESFVRHWGPKAIRCLGRLHHLSHHIPEESI
jgi:hypothetical protein